MTYRFIHFPDCHEREHTGFMANLFCTIPAQSVIGGIICFNQFTGNTAKMVV